MKKLEWVGSSKKILSNFPEAVKDEVGYSLYRVQEGKMPITAKPIKGLGSGVMEIISDYDTNTYRAVYTVNLGEKIYVIHCFQKKSKSGIKTPKEVMNIIQQRLKLLRHMLNKTN